MLYIYILYCICGSRNIIRLFFASLTKLETTLSGFSFFTAEVLPVVEFQLEEGISDEEAVGLIGANKQIQPHQQHHHRNSRNRSSSRGVGGRISGGVRGGSLSSANSGYNNTNNGNRYRSAAQKWREDVTGEGVQVLQFDDDDVDENDGNENDHMDNHQYSHQGMDENGISSPNDPFTYKPTGVNNEYVPVILDRAYLRTLEPTETIVCKWPPPLRYKFYRNLIPEMNISQCQTCFQVKCNNIIMTFHCFPISYPGMKTF